MALIILKLFFFLLMRRPFVEFLFHLQFIHIKFIQFINMPSIVQGNRKLSMVINHLSRKCTYTQITIFHIILEVKSSLTHNLSYFYYSSPVLTGMTWQKPHYFSPIELLNCLTKSILATDCLKAWNHTETQSIIKLELVNSVWGLFHNSYGMVSFHEVNWN